MSWLRIEGRLPNHRKIAPLSDAAFRLHITAKCWCVEERTDGRLPKAIPATLPAAPKAKAITKVIQELTGAQLWHDEGDAYQIHDFRKYNPPGKPSPVESRSGDPELSEKRSAAGQKGAAARWQTDGNFDGKRDGKLPSPDGKLNGKVDSKTLAPAPAYTRAAAGGRPVSVSDSDQPDTTTQGPESSQGVESPVNSGGGDSNQPTICPLNIRDRLEKSGAIAELAKHSGASEDDVRRCLDDFTAYWTIGAGKGGQRTAWAGKARQWVLDQHKIGKLVGLAEGEKASGVHLTNPYDVSELGIKRGAEGLPQ